MAAYIDQHLVKKIRAAGESDLIEVIIIVREISGLHTEKDDGGLARQVVCRAVDHTDVHPQTVRYFPRANAAVILASSRLIQEIIGDKNLVMASATDLDAFPFSTTG